jgi:hypothetical protein
MHVRWLQAPLPPGGALVELARLVLATAHPPRISNSECFDQGSGATQTLFVDRQMRELYSNQFEGTLPCITPCGEGSCSVSSFSG